MKLVVTGSAGGLGRAFLDVVPEHHDVVPFARADLDIGDHQAVMRTIVPLRPDAILNFAAFTRVDACETESEVAYRVNGLAVQSLGMAARACGAMLLHVSTDYVFDGEKEEPYDEVDEPRPISVYARSKLAGENFARAATPEHFIVRTGYVYGGGRDFLSGAVRRLEAGEDVGGLADRTGTPTFVRDLARRIMPLVVTQRFGTYHVAGPEPVRWIDVLHRVKVLGGLSGRLHDQTAEELALPAPRPRNSALRSLFLQEIGVEPLPPLDVALKEFLDAR